MSGNAASRTPNTSSSRNSTSSSVRAKKKRLRRAPSRVRGARTDFSAEDMNGDSPFLLKRGTFSLQVSAKTSPPGRRNHRAREREPQAARHARTPARAASRRGRQARKFRRGLPGREVCALLFRHRVHCTLGAGGSQENFNHRGHKGIHEGHGGLKSFVTSV